MKNSQKLVKKANRLLQRGRFYINNRNPTDALAVYKKLGKLLKKLRKQGICSDKEWAGFLNDKGIALFLNGDYYDSIKTLRRALTIKRELSDVKFIFTTLMNLAKSYRANCQYADSLSLLSEALGLSIELGNKRLENDVKAEISNTELARDKHPLIQFADIRIGTTRETTFSIIDCEYLPNFFDKLTARIETINLNILNSLEVIVNVNFVILGQDGISDNIYKEDEWKKNRPSILEPTVKGSSPNFVVFNGPNTRIVPKDVKIEDEKGNKLSFDSREQNWIIFLPDSYPMGGFVSPMPICEKFKYFWGIARIFYWQLSFKNKYKLQIKISRNSANNPFQFGLFFPFKRVNIETQNVSIEREQSLHLIDSYLKRLPYQISRSLEQSAPKFIDFINFKAIYEFKGDKIHRLQDSGSTVLLETRDFEVLYFELFSLEKKVISKFDLFKFLKNDLDFRREIGNETYIALIEEVRKLPEKCAPIINAKKCRDCVAGINNLCVVNLIGIVCESEILPHHGFEYSDLLVTVQNKKKLVVPVLAKGSDKLTWGNDRGLTRQLIEKLSDQKVDVVIIATSGQIGNHLRIQLENLASLNNKSLIMLKDKDLAQFLHIIKQATK
jgi:tetratricopeptide (TPR) repeat protein